MISRPPLGPPLLSCLFTFSLLILFCHSPPLLPLLLSPFPHFNPLNLLRLPLSFHLFFFCLLFFFFPFLRPFPHASFASFLPLSWPLLSSYIFFPSFLLYSSTLPLLLFYSLLSPTSFVFSTFFLLILSSLPRPPPSAPSSYLSSPAFFPILYNPFSSSQFSFSPHIFPPPFLYLC